MPTFKERYEELYNQFVRKGYDVLTASQLAVARIQYEVRVTGYTYS